MNEATSAAVALVEPPPQRLQLAAEPLGLGGVPLGLGPRLGESLAAGQQPPAGRGVDQVELIADVLEEQPEQALGSRPSTGSIGS